MNITKFLETLAYVYLMVSKIKSGLAHEYKFM